jgi:hypothetical protein
MKACTDLVACRLRLLRLGRVAVQRGGIVSATRMSASSHSERMKACTSVRRRSSGGSRRVLEDAAQHLRGLAPFVALQPEQDRRLVREVLVHRADAHARALGHPRRGEALRAFLRQNLNSRFEDGRDEVGRAGLLGVFSRGDLRDLRRSVMGAEGVDGMRIGNVKLPSYSWDATLIAF